MEPTTRPIEEWEKINYIGTEKINFDNFLDFTVQYLECGLKREFNENEKKLDYFVFSQMDQNKTGFENLDRDIDTTKSDIRRKYINLKEIEQNKLSAQLNNPTQYKKNTTRLNNLINGLVRHLIRSVNQKREVQEYLLFLQECQDVFDEIRFGHVSEYDSEFLKIAGFGNYRSKPVPRASSFWTEQIMGDLKRIKNIINNPREAKTGEQIHKENTEFFDEADRVSKKFIVDNISYVKYGDNFTCVHCKKEYKSSGSNLNRGKAVSNMVKHLEVEHKIVSKHSWNIYRSIDEVKN